MDGFIAGFIAGFITGFCSVLGLMSNTCVKVLHENTQDTGLEDERQKLEDRNRSDTHESRG